MESYIHIEALSKSFAGSDALKGLNAEIEQGQMVGLVGPDGAGKTTLLRMMVGLLAPSSGYLRVGGYENFHGTNEIQNIIGYMPQKFGLYEDLSVRENLELYADLRNLHGAQRSEKFTKLLGLTRLGRFTERLAGHLSGGMKQKLGLACALVGSPDLLLLDEPSVGVDPLSRRDLWDMVGELLDDGMTVVWSTAYLDEAERCDSVLLLNEGELLYKGAPQDLLASMAGRCWHIKGVQGAEKRRLLIESLQADDVVDGLIQGDSIRLVTKEKKPPQDGNAKHLQSYDIIPVPPGFEDAFIDLLGGAPKGSALAQSIAAISPQKEAIIEAEHLTKRFGDFVAAEDVHFTVGRGEIFGLLGPNGAGKSTTFKMLCGLLQPSQGTAHVSGMSLATAGSKARRQIGYMAQKFSLYGHLSVAQNLSFFAGVYGLTGKHKRARIQQMEEIFDLGPFMSSLAEALPLGYKQRLSLACAVIHSPEVLFLDEPTSGVDPLTRREFWNHINGLVEKGVTVMVTTHFMDEAEYCDRINLISDGRSIALGSPEQLKSLAIEKDPCLVDPGLEDAFVTLVGAENILEGIS